MPEMSRRSLLVGGAAAAVAASAPKRASAQPSRARWDVVVVGAGVFGAWTARKLQAAGKSVLLLDAWGPAHARASSGGESRLTRGAYGADAVYTRMALESLEDWRRLSAGAGLPIFHPIGILFFFPHVQPFLEETMRAHRALGLPTELLDQAAMARRFPQIDFSGIEAGVFEPGFGALMARRAVQTLVAEFVQAGGEYRQAAVSPPAGGRRLERIIVRGRRRFGRGALRLRLRPVAGAAVSGPARLAHLPDPAGSVLLRAGAGRHALRTCQTARLGRFQRRRHLLRLSRPRGTRLQDRP